MPRKIISLHPKLPMAVSVAVGAGGISLQSAYAAGCLRDNLLLIYNTANAFARPQQQLLLAGWLAKPVRGNK
jgi:hypothetical protein